MTTTTLIIVNVALVLGLLTALAVVMSTGHRVAGSQRSERYRHDPVGLEGVRAAEELEHAA